MENENQSTKEDPFDYILLKVRPDAHPLYFVLRYPVWTNVDIDPAHDAYFFNEHTCPTNWMSHVVGVISQGDTDPHGFAEFVRRVPPPPDFDEVDDEWLALFPEIEVS